MRRHPETALAKPNIDDLLRLSFVRCASAPALPSVHHHVLSGCGLHVFWPFGETNRQSTPGPLADADEECEPTCDGDTLVRCGEVAIDCPLGCDGATVSCNLLLASNNADSHGFPSAELGDWDIDGPATINTDTGEVTVNGTQQRPPIVGIESEIGFAVIGGAGVFVANSWTVTGGISVIGTRPLIVVSAGDVQLERVIDLSSGQAECTTPTPTSCPGPGGGDGSTSVTAAGGCAFGGEGVQGVGNIPETGGGGGGGLRVGGPGGDSSGGDMAVGGSGGSINPNTACVSEELIPLVGGSGGGRGGEEVGNNAVGGGAGGAIQITSSTAIRFIGDPNRAGIRASGSGGQGGVDGSGWRRRRQWGGAILLEAPLITFENVTLAANGGGGWRRWRRR